MLGPGVTEETAALLEESTEGWAVGLHLAALSLRNRSDPAAFARNIAQHGHQAVTEYLLSEVLAGLPEAQRDCLLQTSLFDRFCASLIDAAQAEDGVKLSGDDFVRAIRRANLFVVSLDDEGTWFRYHHFFGSLLRARLGQRYTDAEIKAVHARASAWFTAHGLVDEAVIHALKAGDPVRRGQPGRGTGASGPGSRKLAPVRALDQAVAARGGQAPSATDGAGLAACPPLPIHGCRRAARRRGRHASLPSRQPCGLRKHGSG